MHWKGPDPTCPSETVWLWLSALIMFSLVACGVSAEPDDIEPSPDPVDRVTSRPDQVQEPTTDDIPPTDKNLVRGNAYVSSTELLILESFPIQVMLAITGDLPTPCDKFGYMIETPNDANQIHLEVYSLGTPGVICVQVLQPFEENISLSNLDTPLEDGSYTVWVNGELVGKFTYPGG